MDILFQFALVLVTSLTAFVVGKNIALLEKASLRLAIDVVLECIGAGFVFLAVNIFAGMAFVLILRAVTSGFLSLYAVIHTSVIILSLLQGVIFQLWWRLGRNNIGIETARTKFLLHGRRSVRSRRE